MRTVYFNGNQFYVSALVGTPDDPAFIIQWQGSTVAEGRPSAYTLTRLKGERG